MIGYNNDEFNISEYGHKLQGRLRRLMLALSIVAIVAFIGMAIFWK